MSRTPRQPPPTRGHREKESHQTGLAGAPASHGPAAPQRRAGRRRSPRPACQDCLERSAPHSGDSVKPREKDPPPSPRKASDLALVSRPGHVALVQRDLYGGHILASRAKFAIPDGFAQPPEDVAG